MLSTAFAVVMASGDAVAVPLCATAADCSLAGYCDAGGRCVCDAGFEGDRCAALALSGNSSRALSPARTRGVRTVWGGHPVLAANASAYHWIGSAISNNCSLASWSTNSYAARAAAAAPALPRANVAGPFALAAGASLLPDVPPDNWDAGSVHGVYALRNPRPWSNGTDAYLLFYTGFPRLAGAPPVGPAPCDAYRQPAAAAVQAARRIGVAFAPAPEGPWQRYRGNPVLGPSRAAGAFDSSTVSNAAPAFDADGSGAMIMAYKGLAPNDGHKSVCTDGSGRPCLGLARARHWSGPWERVGNVSHNASAKGAWEGEDPTLFATARGWHMVYEHYAHDERGSVGAHAWSADGATWSVAPRAAWVSTHTVLDGRATVLDRRERPQVVLEGTPGGGVAPVALFNGACTGGACFNIVEAVGRPAHGL